MEPNRGAFVAQPTVRDAREIFEARRVIEWAVVARALHTLTPTGIKRLREHLRREDAARAAGDRRTLIKLSGEFHLLLGEGSGNSVMSDMLRKLVSRASLIIALYEHAGASSCPPDEHTAILDAIDARNPRAPDMMRHHLEHVERSLMLRSGGTPALDLKAIFDAQASSRTGDKDANQGNQSQYDGEHDAEDRTSSVKVAAPATEIVAVSPSMGPASIEGHYDEAVSVVGLLDEVRKGEAQGVDGYVIACSGIQACSPAREIARGPVIGIAEAAMHLASMISTGFSVVTTLERTCVIAEHLLNSYGMARFCRKVRGTDLAVLELEDLKSNAYQIILAECRCAIEEDRSAPSYLAVRG